MSDLPESLATQHGSTRGHTWLRGASLSPCTKGVAYWEPLLGGSPISHSLKDRLCICHALDPNDPGEKKARPLSSAVPTGVWAELGQTDTQTYIQTV